ISPPLPLPIVDETRFTEATNPGRQRKQEALFPLFPSVPFRSVPFRSVPFRSVPFRSVHASWSTTFDAKQSVTVTPFQSLRPETGIAERKTPSYGRSPTSSVLT
ncbi:unnamed protein product, partial [Ectocarpus sp. 13 AM-2016]